MQRDLVVRAQGGDVDAFSALTAAEYDSYVSAEFARTAFCSFEIVSGFQ